MYTQFRSLNVVILVIFFLLVSLYIDTPNFRVSAEKPKPNIIELFQTNPTNLLNNLQVIEMTCVQNQCVVTVLNNNYIPVRITFATNSNESTIIEPNNTHLIMMTPIEIQKFSFSVSVQNPNNGTWTLVTAKNITPRFPPGHASRPLLFAQKEPQNTIST